MRITNSTGESYEISNVTLNQAGQIEHYISSRPWQRPGSRFFAKWTMLSDTGITTDRGGSVLALAEGWQVDTTTRPAASRPAPAVRPTKPATNPATKPATADGPKYKVGDLVLIDGEHSEIVAVHHTIGGWQYEVAGCCWLIAENAIKLVPAPAPAPVVAAAPVPAADPAPAPAVEIHCENYDRMLRDLRDGFFIYLHGPAGSGKSHTAGQLARDLGLPFYGETTLLFKHEVVGYGNAAGEYVPTSFYKAFKDGGLYNLDELDRSNAEALVAINNALANKYVDFPVVGRVEMHPDFHFVGSGNTTLNGADEEYIAAQIMDASSRDRLMFYEVGYNHEVELHNSGGDAAAVEFCENLRTAIKASGMHHVVSYRCSKYLSKRNDDREFALRASAFKGLNIDDIRILVAGLTCVKNPWYKAAKRICK